MTSDYYSNPIPGDDGTTLEPALRVKGAIDADSGSLGSLVINGILTLGPLGKIVDNDGSEWGPSGITLVPGGAAGDTIVWKNGSTTVGYISASPALLYLNAQGGFGVQLGATSLQLGNQSPSGTTLGPLLYIDTTPLIQVQVSSGKPMTLQDANGDTTVFRRLSVGNQTTRYLDDDGAAYLRVVGGGLDVTAAAPKITAPSGATSGVAAGANMMPIAARWIPVVSEAGLSLFIPAYTAVNPWAI